MKLLYSILAVLLLFTSACGTSKFRLTSKKHMPVSDRATVNHTSTTSDFVSFKQTPEKSVEQATHPETAQLNNTFSAVELVPNYVFENSNARTPLISHTIDKEIQLTGNDKKTEEKRIFYEANRYFLISMGPSIVGTACFFLGSISTYFPLIGGVLLIGAVFFFVKGVLEFRWAKEKLQWYPKEYEKKQKYGLAKAILIISAILLAFGFVGLGTILF